MNKVKKNERLEVLVACEESQVVAKAFRSIGHEAYSNDIIECSGGHPNWHLRMDCMDAVKLRHWDLIIMHPPCTALAVSGNSTYGKNIDGTYKPKHIDRIRSVQWTQALWDLAISVCDKVAMENPVGVLHSMGKFPKAQYIQPYMFGHTEQKKTGFTLHGLPRLVETNNVYEAMMQLPRRERERLHFLPPSKDRAKIRSTTYSGVAEAMAEQWGGKVN